MRPVKRPSLPHPPTALSEAHRDDHAGDRHLQRVVE